MRGAPLGGRAARTARDFRYTFQRDHRASSTRARSLRASPARSLPERRGGGVRSWGGGWGGGWGCRRVELVGVCPGRGRMGGVLLCVLARQPRTTSDASSLSRSRYAASTCVARGRACDESIRAQYFHAPLREAENERAELRTGRASKCGVNIASRTSHEPELHPSSQMRRSFRPSSCYVDADPLHRGYPRRLAQVATRVADMRAQAAELTRRSHHDHDQHQVGYRDQLEESRPRIGRIRQVLSASNQRPPKNQRFTSTKIARAR